MDAELLASKYGAGEYGVVPVVTAAAALRAASAACPAPDIAAASVAPASTRL
jgi:hypothetical protein